MTALHLTPRAVADIEAIADWTLRNWGPARMESYLRTLDNRLRWLAEDPARGQKREEIGSGYRSFPEGRHVIFYSVLADGIAIIGVPHQAMDVDRHFADDR